MSGNSGNISRPPKYVPTETVGQYSDVAVQNVWNTVIDVKQVALLGVCIRMSTAIEDLEVRLTIDGTIYTGAQAAAVAGTDYFISKHYISGSATKGLTLTTTISGFEGGFGHKGAKSIKLEVRKTTALGANNLTAIAVYAQW